MADILDVVELTEFDSMNALGSIIRNCIAIRSDYWYNITKRDQSILSVQFKTKEEQDTILRAIVKELNNATVPSVELLDKIPKCYLKAEQVLGDLQKYSGEVTKLTNILASMKKDNTLKLVLAYSSLDNKLVSSLYVTFKPTIDKLNSNIFTNKEDDIIVRKTLIIYWNLKMELDDPTLYTVAWKLFNDKKCKECGKESCHLKCSVCRVSYYCSKEHQTLNWKEHSFLCYELRHLEFHTSYQVNKIV